MDIKVALACLVLSCLLSISLVKTKQRKEFVVVALLLIIYISLVSLRNGADRGIFRTKALDIYLFGKRHEYFAKELGKIYSNRFGIYYLKNYYPFVYKINKSLFTNLDPSLYFFAGHPRERAGVNEFEKYPFVYLPIFVLGFLYLLEGQKGLVWQYLILAAAVSIFIHPNYNLGPVLFYPFINAILALGFLKLAGKYKL